MKLEIGSLGTGGLLNAREFATELVREAEVSTGREMESDLREKLIESISKALELAADEGHHQGIQDEWSGINE